MFSETSWPLVGVEEHPWVSTIPREHQSSSLRRAHSGPYLAAVVPKIAAASLTLSSEVASLTTEASAEVARFDAELGASLAPFASILLRSESASSSSIENLSSGAKAVAVAELGDSSKRNATEIVGNVAAMRAAIDLADRLDAHALLAMHHALLQHTKPEIAGKWRDRQVWIGGPSAGPHQAEYVAPHHQQVPGLIDDLVAFIARDDLPPMVTAAVAHAQFETIHPFPDGNGRTGRALLHAILRARGLTRSVTVPVSAGLLTDTRAYFATLTAYRQGDPLAIVAEICRATERALLNGRQLVDELRQVRARWDETLVARRDATAWRLADLLLRQPVVATATIVRELHVTANNAPRAIAPLVDVGVLKEFTGFKRNRLWQATDVLAPWTPSHSEPDVGRVSAIGDVQHGWGEDLGRARDLCEPRAAGGGRPGWAARLWRARVRTVELAHDLGGRRGFGAVQVDPDEPVFHAAWERTARALVYAAMGTHPNPTTSAFRHSIERMDPEHYLTSSYYEHWLTAAASVAVESGTIEREELESLAGGAFPLPRPSVETHVEGSGAQRFAVGDRVRVVAADHPGHTRGPGYVRGRVGTVVRVDGRFSLPDIEAHSTRRVIEGTYAVRFSARDLWADADAYAVVNVDLWDSYLEPA